MKRLILLFPLLLTLAFGQAIPPNAGLYSLSGGSGSGGGVTSIIAGTGISVNQATGAVTITNTGGGSGTVTNTAGVLTANALMVGNGINDSKVLASLGTTTTVLHGNVAGLPTFSAVSISADVSGLGTGIATFLGTPSSANFAAAVTDETGTGLVVFNSGAVLTSPAITLNTAIANPAYSEGRLFYDQTDKTLGYYNENSAVTVNVGQEQLIRVINSTGSTIANGIPVYISGATSSLPQITPANASAENTSKVIGLTTNSITNGSIGYVTNSGVVHGMDTTGFTVGVPVFLGTSAGTLTSTAPSGSNYIVQVGNSRVSNASTGEFVVTPMGGRIATSGGTGTVTVVSSGSLTSTALVTGGGTTTLQTPSATATMDASGNISTPGTMTVGNAATTAGAIALTQGTTQSAGTTNITIQAPTSVTSYVMTLPGAVGGANTYLKDVAGNGVLSWATASGAGTVTNTAGALTASALMVGNGTNDSKVLASLGTTTTVLHGNAAGLPTFGSVAIGSDVSGLGTGIATALAVNTGSAGAPVLFNGALGTPSSGTVTNLTGTASININGTVGATTPAAGSFTTLTSSGLVTTGGTDLLTRSAMGALAISVTNEQNTKTVAADSTFTFSATPATGTWFGMEITNSDTNPHVLTWPASVRSMINQGTAATTTIPASGVLNLLWNYDGATYKMYGDPSLVGSVLSSSIATGSAVALTTATAANVTSVTLTPGVWSINGVIIFKPASATSSVFEGTIGTVTATMSTTVPQFTSFTYAAVTSSALLTQQMPTQTVTITTNTTYFLVAKQTFSAGTSAAYGDLRAVRIQ